MGGFCWDDAGTDIKFKGTRGMWVLQSIFSSLLLLPLQCPAFWNLSDFNWHRRTLERYLGTSAKRVQTEERACQERKGGGKEKKRSGQQQERWKAHKKNRNTFLSRRWSQGEAWEEKGLISAFNKPSFWSFLSDILNLCNTLCHARQANQARKAEEKRRQKEAAKVEKAKKKQTKPVANDKTAAKKPTKKELTSDAKNNKKREKSDNPGSKPTKRQKSGDDTNVWHIVQKLSLLPDTVFLRTPIVYLLWHFWSLAGLMSSQTAKWHPF